MAEFSNVRWAATFLISLAAAGCNRSAIKSNDSAATRLAAFEVRLEQLRQDLQIPGLSAAIAMSGTVYWSRGFGLADVENSKPVTATTSFHAASLTKPIAATLLLRLVEQGRLSLDDPVSKFGITIAGADTIRVRHLLSMTSEIGPGEGYRYNGDRFAQLAAVFRSVTGLTFAQLVVDSISAALAMRSSAPNLSSPAFAASRLDSAAFGANLAKPYALQNGRVVATTYPAYFGPAAGLIASAEDLARFSIALDEGRLLQPRTRALMFDPMVNTRGDTLPYALGWFSQRYHGVRVVWVYGLWVGNSSLLIKVPERQLTFVLMANSDQLSARYPLGAGRLLDSAPARLFLDSFVF